MSTAKRSTELSGIISFTYCNYKGVTRKRTVEVIGVFWEFVSYQERFMFVLRATDLEKEAVRSFILSEVRDIEFLGVESANVL